MYLSDITAHETIDGVRIGVTFAGMRPGDDGQTYAAYHWQVNLPGEVHGATDIHGPLTGRDPGPKSMLGTLVVFLEAAAEAYAYEMRGGTSENRDLFPEPVTEWAYQHSDELAMLALDLEGSGV